MFHVDHMKHIPYFYQLLSMNTAYALCMENLTIKCVKKKDKKHIEHKNRQPAGTPATKRLPHASSC